MEIENSASRQRGQTVRIVTDLPVLVQSENTLKRKGRNKPIAFTFGGVTVTLSLTDSGQLVVRIDEPP